MKKVTFECEVVTPMFLSGADGHTPELRGPSIKGDLRFWWRAMNANLNEELLYNEEAKFFGGWGKNQGKSKLQIDISYTNLEKSKGENLWTEIPYTPKSSGTGKQYNLPNDGQEGKFYLFYSILMDYSNPRKYIKTGYKFEVNFKSFYHDVLDESVKAFALLNLFGGLGARTRRGAGAIKVTDVKTNDCSIDTKIFYNENITNKNELINFITTKISPIIINKNPNQTSYSNLSGSKLYIFEPKTNWEEALEVIGKPFKDFRDQNRKPLYIGPNFGFPIIHNRNNHATMGGNKKTTPTPESFIDRRSSPLIFRVIKTSDQVFFPVILWLNGNLLPDGYNIMDKKNSNNAPPNPSCIQCFLNTFSSSGTQNPDVIL